MPAPQSGLQSVLGVNSSYLNLMLLFIIIQEGIVEVSKTEKRREQSLCSYGNSCPDSNPNDTSRMSGVERMFNDGLFLAGRVPCWPWSSCHPLGSYENPITPV